MDPNNIPPLINPPAPEPAPAVSRWRWWLHLIILALFPLLIGALSYSHADDRKTALLPGSIAGLLSVSVYELLFFGVLFLLAWLSSRVSARQLLLKWRGGTRPFWLGLGYSIALRLGVAAIATFVLVLWLLIHGGQSSDLLSARPQVEQIVNLSALANNPLYFILTITLISFVVAGLREELWRAGMFAGLNMLFPRLLTTVGGRLAAIGMVAVIFGLGHTAQGWGGVAITALLGFGLGAIMVWYRSIWEAVLAHGFFDATTFVFLYWLAKFHANTLQSM
ncbi:MAG: Abortive infection protein [Pedosphaera sp.]|jgi:membrane protease YdiL (CAAX protease family)|nr:Abortive infection protein [Pedosphaera sp.]